MSTLPTLSADLLEQIEASRRRGADITIEWPIVTVQVRGAPIGADIDTLFALTLELFASRQRFAFIFDLRNMSVPDATSRRRIAEFQKEHLAQFTRWIIADATIVSSSVVRGVLTMINWFAPAKHPLDFFETRQDALAWVQELIANEPAD